MRQAIDIRAFRVACRLLFVAALLLSGAACGMAQPPAESPQGRPSGFTAPKEQPVQAELITEHASIQLGGQTRIGIHLEIEEGWHIYAKDPGDAGLPTKVAWSGPSDISFGSLQYPTPEHFVDPGDIHTNGYSGATVLYSTLTLKTAQSRLAAIPISAVVEWLACKEVCLPGKARLELSLPVSTGSPVPSTHAELFDHTS